MRNDVEPFTLTGVLAIYGAVLSSIALGWNLYRDLHDRVRLRITARLRRIAQSDVGPQLYAVAPDLPVARKTEGLFVFVEVTNIGRRPVRWDGWGGDYNKPSAGKPSFAIIPVNLPKMLAEGEAHVEYTDTLHADIGNVKRIFIWDASGKHWKLPHRELKKLKADVQKHHAPARNASG
jgi:hypothetical protein